MSSDAPAQQPLGANVWPRCPWSAALGSGACGQTRNSTPAPFNKISDTRGIFHANMGTIKDRNDMDLTEAEDTKKVARIHRRTTQKRSS